MTTIFEMVEAALNTFTPPVPFAQDIFLGELPDTYLVYSLVDDVASQFADNEETERLHRIQVSQYSRDGLVGLPDVDGAMKAAGFKKSNRIKLPYDPDTGHFGLATDYTILLNSN